MDILLIILGVVSLLIGIAGCIFPVLPGTPFAYLALILLHLTETVQFSLTELIVWALFVVVVEALDYVTPLLGAKYCGGSSWGNWGCMIGTFAGLFVFPPWGIIVGPFIGAFLGEIFGGKQSGQALKAGFGAFLGFMLTVVLKMVLCGYFAYCFVKALA